MLWKTRYIRFKRYSRRLTKFFTYTTILLLLLLYSIFQSSYVQTYITQKIGGYLSEKTNTEITIQGVDFHPFDTFILNGLLIKDHKKDTLLYAEDFYFEVNDYDIEKNIYQLDLIELSNSYLNICKYKGDTSSNLSLFINQLVPKNSDLTTTNPINIYVEDIALENLKVRNWDESSEALNNEIDYNNLLVSHINLDANAFVFKKDLIGINLEQLEFQERSGLNVLGMQAQLLMDNKNLVLKYFEFETNETDINGAITLSYNGYKDFSSFNTKVSLKGVFEETLISSNDLAYFVPNLKKFNQNVSFKGEITGIVDELNARNLNLNYGEKTRFSGDIKFTGLTTTNSPVINAEINYLKTINKDILNIPTYPFEKGEKIKLPNWMKNLTDLNFKGKFDGPISNFHASGKLQSNVGDIDADVHLNADTNKRTHITGNVNTKKFQLGKLLGNKDFGAVSMNGDVDALAQLENNRLVFSGEIPLLQYKSYTYSNIKMDGTIKNKIFGGELFIKDPNLDLDFNGQIDFSQPNKQKLNFQAVLNKVNLNKVNWLDRDSSCSVSGRFNVNLTGKNIEDLNGEINIDSIAWHELGDTNLIKNINLRTIKQAAREMMILNSDIMIGKIEGNYNLKEIYPTIINVISPEIPSLVTAVKLPANYRGGNKFSVMMKLKDYSFIQNLFTPEFNIANNTKMSSRFNDADKSFVIHLASDSINFNKKIAKSLKLYANNRDSVLKIQSTTEYVELFDGLGLDNLNLHANIDNNLLNYDFNYKNHGSIDTKGEFSGNLNLQNLDTLNLTFKESSITYRGAQWIVDTTAFVNISGQYIDINHLQFKSNNQAFRIDGIASTNQKDGLSIAMKDFELEGLQYFWDLINIDLAGKATGRFSINGTFGEQLISTQLKIKGMDLNNQSFGDVLARTKFDNSSGIMDVDFSIQNKLNDNKNLRLEGQYHPFDKGKLNLTATFNNTQLKFLERYFEGVFSEFSPSTTIRGELDIQGYISNPEIYGNLQIFRMEMKVDYLNVVYAVDAQKLYFDKDLIKFKDFTLSHNKYAKSKARINGTVNHNGFKNITYRLDSVFLENFFCLNTTINNNSTYYGTAFVNGLLDLRGDGKTNFIKGNVATAKYKDNQFSAVTELILPLDQTEELEMSEFVSFVNLSDTNTTKRLIEEDFDLSGLELDLNFELNNDANVRIIFDPVVGEEITATGHGDIGMQISPAGKFSMYGDYVINKGSYYFTLQNIIAKRFNVEPGSSMTWDGDPLNGQIAMKTYYRSRANLINLIDSNQVGDFNTFAAQYDNRIPVNTNLGLFGSLWKPEIRIGISLPSGSPEEINFLQSTIVGEDEINRQAFSLLLTNQFLPPNSGMGAIVSDKAGINNGMQFVEGQINNALSSIVPNLDLGVDYNDVAEGQNGENLSKDELRLLAGYKYKNLSVRTDFDINNQVGDIEAEFKITDELRAKAYHKTTNDANAINNQTTTTYGLGAAYQKSFDSIKEFFRRKEKETK